MGKKGGKGYSIILLVKDQKLARREEGQQNTSYITKD